MVALTGELGEPPASDRRPVGDSTSCAASRSTATRSSLGALTTYTDIRRSALCREHLPALVEAAATIGAAQIQNRGTLGGNIANASPAGDTLPVLLAADAVVRRSARRGVSARSRPPTFWTAYRQTALAPRRAARSGSASRSSPGREMRFRKVGTRRAQAISKVVMALAWRDAATGGAGATSASRSGPWRPRRSGRPRTEAVLEGAPPTPETADRAAETLAGELAPDRRRPLDRRVPPPRRGAGPPSASSARPAAGDRAGRRDRRRARRRRSPPLFEGAPRFLGRLDGGRPVRDADDALRARPGDRPRDARGRADRADRCPSAARGAARDGVGDVLRRAGVRPGEPATASPRPTSTSPPSSSGSTTRTRPGSGSATASSWPVGRARRCSPGWRPRSSADRDDRAPPGARRGRRHRHRPACEAVGGGAR